MADLGKAYVQIVPSAEGISGKIKKAIGNEGGDAGESVGNQLISKFKSVIVAAGLGTIIKKSLDAGGALQQSFGGIETIYGDAAQSMKDYASAAAMAGISANSYAEQAVSFGASLKQAFGDDIQGAAEAANQAILDMADNSAKMGTDIGAVQSAYQGFAKQNYTMLDNLKLGYGGTKTEMQRLLKDAQKLSGVKYNIDNLGDVYSAIHVIQEELNISGVAAEEAKTTLTGSFGAMKAAAENLMANITLGESIKEPLNQLMVTINNFVVNNLLPMLGNIIASLPELLGSIGTLLQDICNKILEGMPAVTVAALEIMQNLATGLETNIPVAIATMMDMILQLLVLIINSLPSFLMSGWDIIQSIIIGLLNSIPSIVQGTITVLTSLLTTILSNLPQFVQKGIEIILNLITGLLNAIPDIILAIPQIVSAIWDTLMATDWGQLGSDLIAGIANGITNAVGSLVEAAKSACSRLVDGVKSFFQIGSPSKVMAKEVGRWLPPGIADGIEDNMGVAQKAMTDMNTALVGQIDTSFSDGSFSSGVSNGFTQNITIQSPKELSPSEVARQTRNKTRELILSMRGV